MKAHVRVTERALSICDNYVDGKIFCLKTFSGAF